MSFTAATAAWVGVGLAAVGTGMAAAGVGQPKQPNTTSSSKQLSDTNAAMLPIQRQLQAAAEQGGKVTVELPAHKGSQQFVVLTNPDTRISKTIPYVAAEWEAGGKYNPDGTVVPKLITRNVKIPAGPQTFDFTGLGKADVQTKLAEAQAKLGLELGQKYDQQFIDEALKQEAEADPEAVAARAKMNELIRGQIDRTPERPVADMLEQQVGDALQAAGDHRLTAADQARLDAAVAEAQAARGKPGAPVDFTTPLTTGTLGAERENAARLNAMGWLGSGATAEDTAYRREQQNLTNLSAQVNGRTPQSQFANLSGAQQGPTPMTRGGQLPLLPGNADQVANAAAISGWKTNLNDKANQVSPWLAGLSGLINTAGAAGRAGWKPLGS